MRHLLLTQFVLISSFSSFTFASTESVGPLGINAAATGLTGAGVKIGMSEQGRAGGANFDTDPLFHNDEVNIDRAFSGAGNSPANSLAISNHATAVAGVMVASNGGVAPMALLHTGSANVTASGPQADQAVSMNAIAKVDDMRAINLSFGFGIQEFVEQADGNNFMSQFVDWSAEEHQVLYVAAMDEFGKEVPTPADNFNGITVGFSGRVGVGGPWAITDSSNDLLFDAVGNRSSIDILAPGTELPLTHTNNVTFNGDSGTSYAAPHVTGTVALLDQFANQQIPINSRFNATNPHRPQVMKAVILNSADKLPGVHGSTKRVTDRNGLDWEQVTASSSNIRPLDEDFGAGHLNAKNALTQFEPGEHDPGMVPLIGWDYDFVGGGNNEYEFNAPSGGWLAATLTWHREVELTNPDDNYSAGDTFFDYADIDDVLENLNLYLMEANENNPLNAVARSTAVADNVEHIFFDVETAGNFKLRVQNDSQLANGVDYSLAWWFGEAASPFPEDFDADGDVDAADLAQWQGDFGANGDSDADNDGDTDGADFLAWQRNFGATSLSASTAVPEPTSLLLLVLGLPMLLSRQGIRPENGPA